jgi:hypothetical protein
MNSGPTDIRPPFASLLLHHIALANLIRRRPLLPSPSSALAIPRPQPVMISPPLDRANLLLLLFVTHRTRLNTSFHTPSLTERAQAPDLSTTADARRTTNQDLAPGYRLNSAGSTLTPESYNLFRFPTWPKSPFSLEPLIVSIRQLTSLKLLVELSRPPHLSEPLAACSR